ncbi:MAG: hypothetical protein HRT47_14120 [Candidatus Caenarcaniphilales bacterium]|nr:hypothetical protein [Candidatus Caenarcaniphilales bacterium]
MSLITNITHFLDENGEIPELPEESIVLLKFLTDIISEVSKEIDEPIICTSVECREPNGTTCSGEIDAWCHDDGHIEWICNECNENGTISHWRECQWDNSIVKLH